MGEMNKGLVNCVGPLYAKAFLSTDHNPDIPQPPKLEKGLLPPIRNQLFKGGPVDRLHLSKIGSRLGNVLRSYNVEFLGQESQFLFNNGFLENPEQDSSAGRYLNVELFDKITVDSLQ